MKRSTATYIEHKHGDDVEGAIAATRAEAVERLGGADVKLAQANAHGVSWVREWDEPEPAADPVA